MLRSGSDGTEDAVRPLQGPPAGAARTKGGPAPNRHSRLCPARTGRSQAYGDSPRSGSFGSYRLLLFPHARSAGPRRPYRGCRLLRGHDRADSLLGSSGSQVVLAGARAFGDSVTTHPDYACILLEWSTAIRSELWPLYLRFQERMVGIVADTIRRWRTLTGSNRLEDAENDARVIASTGYVLAQMKITQVPQRKIDRFLQTVLYDTLGVHDLRLVI